MLQVNELTPGKTYKISKTILDINLYFPVRRGTGFSFELGKQMMSRFIVPMGTVYGFGMISKKIMMVVKFHPESILQNLPKQVRNMEYFPSPKQEECYLEGKLGPVCEEGYPDNKDKAGTYILKKGVARGLQSFAINYNRKYKRKDRLSSRPLEYYELESEEEVQEAIAEIDNAHIRNGANIRPDKCRTNCFRETLQEISECISISAVKKLFGGNLNTYAEKVLLYYYQKIKVNPGIISVNLGVFKSEIKLSSG